MYFNDRKMVKWLSRLWDDDQTINNKIWPLLHLLTNHSILQQVPWTKISSDDLSDEEKNQGKSFTKRKINMQQVSRTKTARKKLYEQNQHAICSTNKISLTKRKINLQVSWREKSTCNKFHEQKPACNKFK